LALQGGTALETDARPACCSRPNSAARPAAYRRDHGAIVADSNHSNGDVTAIHARRLFEEKRSATEQPLRHDQAVAEHRDRDIDPERDHDVYARLSNDSYQKSLRDDYVRLMRQILIYARA
jgi:hypothetical protein